MKQRWERKKYLAILRCFFSRCMLIFNFFNDFSHSEIARRKGMHLGKTQVKGTMGIVGTFLNLEAQR